MADKKLKVSEKILKRKKSPSPEQDSSDSESSSSGSSSESDEEKSSSELSSDFNEGLEKKKTQKKKGVKASVRQVSKIASKTKGKEIKDEDSAEEDSDSEKRQKVTLKQAENKNLDKEKGNLEHRKKKRRKECSSSSDENRKTKNIIHTENPHRDVNRRQRIQHEVERHKIDDLNSNDKKKRPRINEEHHYQENERRRRHKEGENDDELYRSRDDREGERHNRDNSERNRSYRNRSTDQRGNRQGQNDFQDDYQSQRQDIDKRHQRHRDREHRTRDGDRQDHANEWERDRHRHDERRKNKLREWDQGKQHVETESDSHRLKNVNEEVRKKPAENQQPKEEPNYELSGKLTEFTNTYKGVVIKYNEPPEARKPKTKWRLYPFKGDQSLPVLYIHRQSAFLLGRNRMIADIPVDHPSCSSQHAVIQFRLVDHERPDGSFGRKVKPYVIDLESSNGTFVNNNKIEERRYVELKEKDVLKFGFSSREYVILHDQSKDEAPPSDEETEKQ